MDSDTEVENIFTKANDSDDEDERKKQRPPSSYGSMKSESDDMEDPREKKAEEAAVAVLPNTPAAAGVGIRTGRSMSPETLYTIDTEQTKPPGALVFETSSYDFEDLMEEDEEEEEDEDEILETCSPVPPELELEEPMSEEASQPGKMPPEQDLPHVFKCIQKYISELSRDEFMNFQARYSDWQYRSRLKLDGDVLDFVDGLIEQFGQEKTILATVKTLEILGKEKESKELFEKCHRALSRFELGGQFILSYKVIREAVAPAGRQSFLNNIYVEQKITRGGYGAIDPTHEFLEHPFTPVRVPSPDSFFPLNDIFRLKKPDGTPVRVVVTTGRAVAGKTICVKKFTLDWAEGIANRDLPFVVTIPLRIFWYQRDKCESVDNPKEVSFKDVCEYYNAEIKAVKYMDDEGHNFLLIMDTYEAYNVPLDWENAPVITSVYTKTHIDNLVVNVIRGNLVPGARIWILGRRSAVLQIPSKYIDEFTELQGFTEQMRNEFITKRSDDIPQLGEKILRQINSSATLFTMCGHPFFIWMMAYQLKTRIIDRRITQERLPIIPFYVNMMVVMMSRRRKHYLPKQKRSSACWIDDEVNLAAGLMKLAFTMLEKKTSVFHEEDLKEVKLNVRDVAVESGVVNEIARSSDGRRAFSFIHFTFQEYLAAQLVFLKFHLESKNILETSSFSIPKSFRKYTNKSAASLVQHALSRYLNSPRGHYDLFLRFICGFMNPICHEQVLSPQFCPHRYPKVTGLEEVQKVLEQAIENASEDRAAHLRECITEMTLTNF